MHQISTVKRRTKNPSHFQYYLSPKYSDLTITCGGVTFPAHKLVVCSQSKYFPRACDGEFQGSSGTIKIDEGNAIIIQKVLQFLYTGDYQVDLESFIPPYPEIVNDILGDAKSGAKEQDSVDYTASFHVLMYAQADYFQIEDLKTLALEDFCDAFRRTTNIGQSRAFIAAVVQISKFTLEDEELRKRAIEMMVQSLPQKIALIPYKALELLPDISQQLAICLMYRHSTNWQNWSKHQ